mmetsp:Transcript_7532/g.13584  ORF Transcript_7532/g.13584 Transcript_7532/m.13584 type:complete len:314 (+) Transcript_7532:107-1048(+)
MVQMNIQGPASIRLASLLLWLGLKALVVEAVRPIEKGLASEAPSGVDVVPAAIEGNPLLLQSAEVDSRGMSTFPVLPSSELSVSEEEDVAAVEAALSRMEEHLEQLGNLSEHSFKEDLELLARSNGNLSTMTSTGQHLLGVLEETQAAWARLKPEEAHQVESLLARKHFGNPKKNKKKLEVDDEDENHERQDGEPEVVTQEKSKMSSTGFKIYKGLIWAYEKLAGTRRNINAIASFAAMLNKDLVKDSIVLKLIFLLYTDPLEDDYPYIPRNCGAFDSFMEVMAGRSPRLQPSSWLVVLSLAYTFYWVNNHRR